MSDPTGTAGIRRSFVAEANRRLSRLRSMTHTVLVERDLMQAKNDPVADLLGQPGHRLAAFAGWFERAANEQLGGPWPNRFLQRAHQSGTEAAGALMGKHPSNAGSVPNVYQELVQREFSGIAAAMVQQVSRAAGNAALAGNKPLPMYRAVLSVLRKVGEARVKATVNTTTVQLHNAARLMQYRAAGIAQVGIVPEIPEPARSSPFGARRTSHDANPYHDPHGRFTTGGGAGGSGGEGGAAAVTKTPAFKNWFGKSQVVGEHGSPLVVYHGSGHDIGGEFSKGKIGSRVSWDQGYLGHGFYFGNPKMASVYGGEPHGGNVTPVYLSMQHPLRLAAKFKPGSEHRPIPIEIDRALTIRRALDLPNEATSKQVTERAKERGHDGVIYNYRGDNEYVVFEPHQIKSAIGNIGTFSREKPGMGDAGPPDEPRDPHGQWTGGGGGGLTTKTPEFKSWFGKSKVVNPDGSPRTVYHGTTTPEDFHHFSVGEPVEDPTGEYHRSGSGSDPRTFLGSHFAQEPHVANKFAQGLYGERAGRSEGGRVLPVHLRVENPHVSSDSKMLNEMMRGNYNHHDIDAALEEHGDIEETGPKYDSDPNYREEINQRAIDMGQQADEPDHSLAQEMAQQYRQKLQEKGHDGIKYRNEIEGGTSWIIFHPGQVKSAIGNIGRFSRKKHGIGDHFRDDSYILQAKQALEAAQQALTEAQARTAQAELEASQAQARAEVAAAKAETAQNEAETTAAEAAQGGWTAKQQEYRTTKAEVAAAAAEAAQNEADQAQEEADQAESDAEQARQDEADAQAALEALPSLFAVLTAGDDKVCQICQDLAAEGPYSVEEAWPLLPAHPNCRCAWIPAGEATGEE